MSMIQAACCAETEQDLGAAHAVPGPHRDQHSVVSCMRSSTGCYSTTKNMAIASSVRSAAETFSIRSPKVLERSYDLILARPQLTLGCLAAAAALALLQHWLDSPLVSCVKQKVNRTIRKAEAGGSCGHGAAVPEEHDMRLWLVNGVVHPASALLHAYAPPLILQHGRSQAGVAVQVKGRESLRPPIPASCQSHRLVPCSPLS